MSRHQIYEQAKNLARQNGQELNLQWPRGSAQEWQEEVQRLQARVVERRQRPALPQAIREEIKKQHIKQKRFERKQAKKAKKARKVKYKYTLHIDISYDIEGKEEKKSPRFIRDVPYKFRRKKKTVAREALEDFANRYDYNFTDIKFNELRLTKIPIIPREEALRRVREEKLNNIVYTLEDSQTSERQYKKNCMSNYFLEIANGRDKKAYKPLDVKKFTQKYKDGMSLIDVETECKKYGIGAYAIQNNEIICKVERKQHQPVLMFQVSNTHCYPIADEFRKSFTERMKANKWKKAEQKATAKKDKFTMYKKPLGTLIKKCMTKIKPRTLKQIKEGKPKPDLEARQNYIVENLCVDDVLRQFKENKTIFSMTTNKKGQLTSLKFRHGKIINCMDFDSKKACQELGREWKGESFPQIANILFKEFYRLTPSTFNQETINILDQIGYAPLCFRNTESIKLNPNSRAIDIRRCYTASAIQEQDYPIFDVLDEIEPYNGGSDVGIYYIEADNPPLVGSSWYSHNMLKYVMENNIIKPENVKYQLLARRTLSHEIFKKFFQHINDKVSSKNAKKIFNYFIGLLNSRRNEKTKHIITTSGAEAIKHSQGEEATAYNDGTFWYITQKQKIKCNYSNSPLYLQIIDNGRIRAYELSKLCDNVQAIKTDCVIFSGKFKGKLGEEPGEYREEKLPDNLYHVPIFQPSLKYTPIFTSFQGKHNLPWKITEHGKEAKLPVGESLCLTAPPGYGKSYLSAQLEGDKMAFTNTACNRINGETINHYLKLSQEDDSITNFNGFNNKKVIIDEVSMVPPKLWAIFMKIKLNNPDFKIICVGDFEQIQFIPEVGKYEQIIKETPRIENREFFKWLCEYERHILTHCWRAEKKLDEVLKTRKYETITGNHSDSNINITITNYKRWLINTQCNKRFVGKSLGQAQLIKILEQKGDTIERKITWDLKENSPWIAKISNKKLNILKNEFYTMHKGFKMTLGIDGIEQNGGKSLELQKKEDISKYFEPAYAFTVNKLQGCTITKPFIIHEWEHKHNDKYKKYTSISRAKYAGQFNIVSSRYLR